jgi:hypothetical protein
VRVAVSIGNNKVMDGNGLKVSVGPIVFVKFGVFVAVKVAVLARVPDKVGVEVWVFCCVLNPALVGVRV